MVEVVIILRRLKPIDLARFYYCPDRRLCGVEVSLLNEIGIFLELFETLRKNKITIVHFTATISKTSSDLIDLSLIVDLTDSNISPMELRRLIIDLEGVKKVGLIEQALPGLFIDEIHFPTYMGGFRAVILDEHGFKALVKDIRDEWGTAAEVFLYEMGVKMGEEYWKFISQLLRAFSIVDRVKALSSFLKLLGLGIAEIMKIDLIEGFVVIRIYDSLECAFGKGLGKRYSHFIRGLIAGAAKSALRAKSVEVVETRCIAIGDPYCEFEVKVQKE